MANEEASIELDQNMPVQERAWRFERVGWGVLTLLVLLALLGLFGSGPLSSTTATTPDNGIAAAYERFVRHDGSTSVELTIGPGQASDGEVEVWISASYLDDMEVEQIAPQPDEVRSNGDRQGYVFLVDDPSTETTVTFQLRPDAMGRITGDVGIVDGSSVTINQLSFP